MQLTDADAKIYVAGHRGMVGRALWRHLEDAGYTTLVGRTSDELDLRDPAATRQFFADEQRMRSECIGGVSPRGEDAEETAAGTGT